MKRLFILLLLALCIIPVSANSSTFEYKRVYVDGNVDDYFLPGDYINIENDLQYIRDNFNIEVQFSISAVKERNDSKFYHIDADMINARHVVVLEVGVDGGSFYASGPLENELYKQSDALWNEFYQVDNWNDAIVAFYQAVVKAINTIEYEISVPINNEKLYFVDRLSYLSDDEEAEVNKYLENLSRTYNFDIVGLIMDNPGDLSFMAFADDYYDYNNFAEDGCLFVLFMDDRDWYFSTAGRGIDEITDKDIDRVFEHIRYDLSENDFYNAFKGYGDKVVDVLNDSSVPSYSKPISKIDSAYLINQTKSLVRKHTVGVSSFFGAVGGLLFFFVQRAKMRLKHVSRAEDYYVKNSFFLTGSSDRLVDTKITRKYSPVDDSDFGSRGGGGGGDWSSGGSSHTSSSGSSHGGHGGKF